MTEKKKLDKKGKPTPKNPQKRNLFRRISNCYFSEGKKRYWRKKMIERSEKLKNLKNNS
jgi:hypothetical protein